VIVKLELVAPVSPLALALMVYAPAVPVVWQPANVATPLLAANGFVVQLNVAPEPGWLAIASVIGAADAVTVFPDASCTVTTGCVANAAPAPAPTGWVVNATFEAAAAVMVNEVLVAWVSTPLVALRVNAPALSIPQPAKLATPATAASGFVVQPLSVPVPVLIARVIDTTEFETVLLFAS
jgi:hypothetical protein